MKQHEAPTLEMDVEVPNHKAPVRRLPKEPGRNSWSNETRRKSRLLGKDFELDRMIKLRVKWGERVLGMCCVVCIVCFFVGNLDELIRVSAGVALGILAVIYYKNISFVMFKRLFKEVKVVIIVMLAIFNFVIELYVGTTSSSGFNGFLYLSGVVLFVFADAVVLKSRYMVLGYGLILVVLSSYNAYENTFTSLNEGIILVKYAIGAKEFIIWKRDAQRSIFLQILFFNAKAVKTMFVDRNMELMLFGTGKIHRAEVERLQRPTARQIYRVRWTQRSIIICGCFAFSSYIVAAISNIATFQYVTIAFVAFFLVLVPLMFYKNSSMLVLKRLLKEHNVKYILLLVICNLVVMIVAPRRPLSAIFASVYILIIGTFIFFDILVAKSRYFLIMIGSIFIGLSIHDLYGNTFDDWNVGSVVAAYTVNGNDHTLMARPILRSIYLQILFLSTSAVYTLVTDGKMEFMLFATGNIYKSTGTSSPDVVDASYRGQIVVEEQAGEAGFFNMRKHGVDN